ncbi:unnamed protein product [Amoebophrya sp. A120]|nr:unnamed protein product [Amoebophrya sp. A120]|eukprot:GSA120T00025861001.1
MYKKPLMKSGRKNDTSAQQCMATCRNTKIPIFTPKLSWMNRDLHRELLSNKNAGTSIPRLFFEQRHRTVWATTAVVAKCFTESVEIHLSFKTSNGVRSTSTKPVMRGHHFASKADSTTGQVQGYFSEKTKPVVPEGADPGRVCFRFLCFVMPRMRAQQHSRKMSCK